MSIILICPGIHEPRLTESFVSSLRKQFFDNSTRFALDNILVFPEQGFFPLSGIHILQFLYHRLGNLKSHPVLFISFSAGVVGAIVAACKWQMLGGQITAFIAIDGWGVPLWGDFPIHRMSHDYFTHWSSSFLGEGQNNFYADPPVDHLEMWRSPQTVQGWCTELSGDRLTAAEFLHILVNQSIKN